MVAVMSDSASKADPVGDLQASAPRRRSAYLPILLLALSALGLTGFQGYGLWKHREALMNLRVNQQSAVDDGQKLRVALDKLAGDTKLLADQGNANARYLVSELGKRGIAITPPEAAQQRR
jgi:hypothetical protein